MPKIGVPKYDSILRVARYFLGRGMHSTQSSEGTHKWGPSDANTAKKPKYQFSSIEQNVELRQLSH